MLTFALSRASRDRRAARSGDSQAQFTVKARSVEAVACDELAADRAGEPRPRQQRLADFAIVAETREQAAHRGFSEIGAGVQDERDRRLARAAAGERGGDCRGHMRAARDRGLRESVAERGELYQLGFQQERRTR